MGKEIQSMEISSDTNWGKNPNFSHTVMESDLAVTDQGRDCGLMVD